MATGPAANSTVMGISIWGKVQSTIAEGVATALQGYNPGATGPTPEGGRYGPGPVQGPFGFQPDAPGKQGALPFGQQYADLSQSLGRAAPSGMTGRPGEIGSQQPMFSIPGLDRLSPIIAPPAPPAPTFPGIILAGAGRDPFGVMGNIGAPPTGPLGPQGTPEWAAPGLAPTFRDPDQSYPPAGPEILAGKPISRVHWPRPMRHPRCFIWRPAGAMLGCRPRSDQNSDPDGLNGKAQGQECHWGLIRMF